MSDDDLVKQSIAELQDLVRCRCHPAYTGRGIHASDCECDSAEAVQVVADRIEELDDIIRHDRERIEELVYMVDSKDALIEELKAKLAKAVDALDWIGNHMVMSMALNEDHLCRMMKQCARATLAELKGETDE
jgi:hypothetical protein